MATINGSTNSSQWTFKLEATETATSILNKTSTVKIQVYLGRTNSKSYLGGDYNLTVKCAGQTQKSNGNIPYPTYIDGGKWYLLKTFTFTVSNTENPTTIEISSSMSSSDFTPSSASANGNLTLTKLHDAPLLSDVKFTETNQQLININVGNDYFVTNLSVKNIQIDAITFDDATITKYEVLNGDKSYSSATNVVQMNLKENSLETIYSEELQRNVAKITIRLTDSLGGVSEFAYPYSYVIPYTKPSVEKTSTTIKRKTGNGTVLTDNIAVLNFIGTCYKGNDVVGNANKPTVQYKIWNASEPDYSTLTTPNTANVNIKDYEINDILYTSTYNYKIKIYDVFTTTETTINVKTDKVPTGVSVWTEYSDRVDFLKITEQGKDVAKVEKITTSEIKTNTFLSGKAVYKKLFVGSMPTTTGAYDIPVDVDFSDAWVDESLSYISSDTETLSTNFYQNNTDYLRTRVSKTEKYIRMIVGGNYSAYRYNLVLSYTKD